MRAQGIVITSLLLGFAASAGLNAIQHLQSEEQKYTLTTELKALQNQAQALRPDTAVATPSPSPSTLPAVAGQSVVTISIYDVSLVATDTITDLVYGTVTERGEQAAAFTTQKLLAKYSTCKPGALGTLTRKKAGTPSPSPSPTVSSRRSPTPTRTPANRPFSKTVAGYTYSYKAPTFTCVTDRAGRDAVAAAVATLKNGALPTLTPSP